MSSESETKKCGPTAKAPETGTPGFLPVEQSNTARLVGKLSRRGPLAFTPSGYPQWEATIGFRQRRMTRESIGYVQLVFEGEAAVVASQRLKVGDWLSVSGSLWSREFKDVRGRLVAETKFLVIEFEERTDGDGR